MKKILLLTLLMFIYYCPAQNNILPSVNQIEANYKSGPAFIQNNGQWESNIRFISFNDGYNIIITNNEIVYDVYKDKEISKDKEKFINRSRTVTSTQFLNSEHYPVSGQEELSYYRNYFQGNDKSHWASNVKSFKNVVLENIYPNIDVVFQFDNDKPRYDFIVRPGGNPNDIQMQFTGSEVNKLSDVSFSFPTVSGAVTHDKIFAYQDNVLNYKQNVDCRLVKEGNTISFKIGEYDKSRTLIIDPTVFATYWGGSELDEITDVVIDNNGDIIVCGNTESDDFKYTPGAYDTTYYSMLDVFVSKFRIEGATQKLVFSTYISGVDIDSAVGVEVDLENMIYVAGITYSKDFPAVNSVINCDANHGLCDGFISKFNTTGTVLLNSSYIGGSKNDFLTELKVTSGGSAIVIGYSESTNYPTTAGAFQTTRKALNDMVVTKTSSSGSAMDFSTFIGGNNDDKAWGIEIDESDNIYIAGETASTDFPALPYQSWGTYVTQRPYDYSFNGETDACFAELTADGSKLEFSTYFGGPGKERGKALYPNGDGTWFFCGDAYKSKTTDTLPMKGSSYQTKNQGGWDMFFGKMDKIKTTTQWGQTYKTQDLLLSTFLGGTGDEIISKIHHNINYGLVYMAGRTTSSNFPKTVETDKKLSGNSDAFVSCLANTGSELVFSNLFGGTKEESGNGIFLDSRGDIFVAGSTTSNDFRGINTNLQPNNAGKSDGFLVKYAFGTIVFTSPQSNISVCPGTVLEIKWTIDDVFTNKDKFKVEFGNKAKNEWITIYNDTGISYKWNIPMTLTAGTGNIFRISHSSGIYVEGLATVTIFSAPKLTNVTHTPENLVVCEGENIAFNIEATGDELTYQLKYKGNIIKTSSQPSFTIEKIKSDSVGDYSIIVKGKCSPQVESQVYNISVKLKTLVTTEPKDTSIKKGQTIVLTCAAQGIVSGYQWYKDGVSFIGGNQATVTIPNAQTANSGKYYCVVTGECGTDTTREAVVYVDPTDVEENNNDNFLSDIAIDKIINSSNNNEITTQIVSYIYCIANISIVDNLAKTVLQFDNKTINIGETEFVFNTAKLPSGIYWLVVECGINKTVKKFSITR